ncbi:MAG: GntR family transcriptional regulator [Pseudomonadota bacterium]
MKTVENQPDPVSNLQRQIAARVLEIVTSQELAAGAPLRESVLARSFSVSRTPVRAALEYLCELGVAEYLPRRGYFLRVDADDVPQIAPASSAQTTRRVYNQIIDAYFDGTLSDRVSEAELMRRYEVDRHALLEALNKLSSEGIMRQNPGYGWQFAPLLKSRQADAEDLFRFRLLLEPAVFLEPGYTADPEVLSDLKIEQTALLESLTAEFDLGRIYAANNRLHDTLTSFCGNRFLIAALDLEDPEAQINEYRHYQDRARIRSALTEHIAILDAVQAGALKRASQLMRKHISMAQKADMT